MYPCGVFSPKHHEVSSELLHIKDKVLESLTTGGIPWGNTALDDKLRLEVAGVIHGMAQFPEDRLDAGISVSPRRGCAPPAPPPPPVWGGTRTGGLVTPPAATAQPPAGVAS